MINGRKKQPISRHWSRGEPTMPLSAPKLSFLYCHAGKGSVPIPIHPRLDYHFKRGGLKRASRRWAAGGRAGRRAGSRDPWPPSRLAPSPRRHESYDDATPRHVTTSCNEFNIHFGPSCMPRRRRAVTKVNSALSLNAGNSSAATYARATDGCKENSKMLRSCFQQVR